MVDSLKVYILSTKSIFFADKKFLTDPYLPSDDTINRLNGWLIFEQIDSIYFEMLYFYACGQKTHLD